MDGKDCMNFDRYLIAAGIIPSPSEEWDVIQKVTSALIDSHHLFLGFVVDMYFINFNEYPVSFAQGCYRLMEEDTAHIRDYAKELGFSLTELKTCLTSTYFDHLAVDTLIRKLGEIASTTETGELEI